MKILQTIKSFNTIRKHGAILKVVEDIFNFVYETHKQQKPMLTKVVLLNMRDGTKLGYTRR